MFFYYYTYLYKLLYQLVNRTCSHLNGHEKSKLTLHIIKLSVKSSKLSVFTLSSCLGLGQNSRCNQKTKVSQKPRKKNTRWNLKMHQFWCFLEFHPVFFCFLPMCLDSTVFVSHAPWQSNNFIYDWQMLQVASVKWKVANVRCRVSKWVMVIVNEKCLKLQAANVRVQVANIRCRVFEWANVKVLNEWVRCKWVNERSEQQEELKAPEGLLAPHSPSSLCKKSSCKRIINRGLSCKRSIDGGRLYIVVNNHTNLIATHLLG